jgi:starch synthase
MKVLMAAPEVAPFAKTGGLADVVCMLCGALAGEGVQTEVILPLYRQVGRGATGLKSTGESVTVDMAGRPTEAEIFSAPLPLGAGRTGRAWLVSNPQYFDREHLYGTEEGDYADNCERFVFFCRAAVQAMETLKLEPDIVHCYDWQTALIPIYLRTLYAGLDVAAKVQTLLTVHNLAFQGLFWHWDWPLTGLDWSLFSWRGLEFYGKMNLLKGGLIFADAISTVSKTYAQEIQSPEYGCGLEGVLEARRQELYGVVTGLDYTYWDPGADKHLPARFGVDDVAGKQECKLALQRECGLEEDGTVPLAGMIGRLSDRKGYDLLEECFEGLMELPVQLVLLAEEGQYDDRELERLCERYAGRAFLRRGVDEPLCHRIFAGSDMLLMPSRSEACGLSQLIAMRYGSVPVVHHTGGLADTVEDLTPEGLEDGTATGFVFLEYNAAALCDEVARAVDTYQQPEIWTDLMKNAMRSDWSYRAGARRYRAIYEHMLES